MEQILDSTYTFRPAYAAPEIHAAIWRNGDGSVLVEMSHQISTPLMSTPFPSGNIEAASISDGINVIREQYIKRWHAAIAADFPPSESWLRAIENQPQEQIEYMQEI